MKKGTIKRWRAMQWILSVGVAIWLGQGIFYLIKYGWHLEAVTITEEIWRLVVDILFTIGIFLFFTVTADVVGEAVNAHEDSNTNP